MMWKRQKWDYGLMEDEGAVKGFGVKEGRGERSRGDVCVARGQGGGVGMLTMHRWVKKASGSCMCVWVMGAYLDVSHVDLSCCFYV